MPTSTNQSTRWQRSKSPNTPLTSFLAGISGGSASTFLLYPLDLIKVRMQVDERRRESVFGITASSSSKVTRSTKKADLLSDAGNRRSICNTVRGIIRNEGFFGLYRGLTPAVIGSATSWGGFFILYEEIKRKMLLRKKSKMQNTLFSTANINSGQKTSHTFQTKHHVRLGPVDHFAASCLAGACLVALTNPIWLIKTRLQLQSSYLEGSKTGGQTQRLRPAYRGIFHAARTIVQEEGFLALYKGSIPALMLTSHGGIQFVTYEFLKHHFADFAVNSRQSGNEWTHKERGIGTIGERLHNSLGYLIMGALSKL